MAVVTEQLTTTVTKTTEHDYIYRSKLPDIYIPNQLPLHTYCFEHLPESRDRSCLIDCPTGRVYTYGEVELISRRVAAGLAIHGIHQRDVVMCLLPNSVEFAFIFLGASFRGATTTTANPFYTAGEIAKQIRAAKARMVFTQSVYVDKLREIVEQDPGLKIVCVDAVLGATPKGCLHMSEFIEADESELPEVEISPEDVVALPYSSGTTGMPKGVMLTHKGLVTSVAQQVDGENPNLYFTNEDVLLCVLPLFHIYSLNSVLLCGLRAGSTILIMPKFDIVGLMELVQRYKVTIAPFVPPIVLSIVKCPELENFDLSSIRTVMSGAAPMGKELQDALMARIPNATLGQGYGMTEAGPVLSMCLAFAKEPVPVKSGSCGTVVRNAEMKIVDPETGASLARNQAGEICIRGAQIMKGYLNDPEATARTIDQDGWLHTGDVGFIDQDEELFIVDRLKELIKYKGFQVAPAELEALLITHPSIADAAVVPMKDEACGEIPVAFVVRSMINGGCATDDHPINISEEDVKKYIAKQVVFYKKLHKVFFLESIPKAPSGKILRKELRARLASTTK